MSKESLEKTTTDDITIVDEMEKVDEKDRNGDEEQESSPSQTVSNFAKIEFRTVTTSSVIVEWIYLNQFPTTSRQQAVEDEQLIEHDESFIYKVLKLETRGEWKTIARTKKTSCQIDNLEPNVCYSLKIHVLVEDVDRFRVVDESEVFKVSGKTFCEIHVSLLINTFSSAPSPWCHRIKHSFAPSQNHK